MSSIHITNESTVKNIYFRGRNPNHPPVIIEKNRGEKTIELGTNLKKEFVFYTEDGKAATYNYITILNPGGQVKIAITTDNSSKELSTLIDWTSSGTQKSRDSRPPDNVNVGVKE